MKKNSIIKNIKEYLKNEYGTIQPEWELIIELLADNIEQYIQVQKKIDENGIFDPTTFKKNPLLATLKDLQATMLKQVQHLGISPYSQGKIKIADNSKETTVDAKEFVNGLLNG